SHSYADSAGFLLLVAEDQQVGDLLHGEIADLGVHLFVAAVELDPEAGGLKLLHNLFAIVVVTFCDGYQADLHGREPERKVPGVVLDEIGDHALHGADDGAMDHDGPVLPAVGGGIDQAELAGQMEIDLNGGVGLFVPHHIGELYIQFGAVKGGVTT